MARLLTSFKKWFLLVFLLVGCFSLLYFDVPSYLTFSTLKNYQSVAQTWTQNHYIYAVSLYILIFTGLIACAIPAATVLTLLGGFLFGTVTILYAELATTLGGLILFFAVRTSIGTWIAKRSSGWIKIMEQGFKRNAFHYLLMLRLVPIFPCWISNVSAGALNVPVRTFVLATLIGIFPSTVIYAMVGRGLDTFFASDQPPTIDVVFTPAVFFPLIGLIILTLIPAIYKAIKKTNRKS